jgi:hypothetical protein
MKTNLLLELILWTSFSIISAQQSSIPIDLQGGIANNSIVVESHTTLDLGSIASAFDNNLSTIARTANSNPMTVILQFKNRFTITEIGIANNTESVTWSIESAETISDLNGKIGTYRMSLTQVPHQGARTSLRQVMISGHWIKLTINKLCCDNYVHLSEWSIKGSQDILATSICMKPNQVRLIPGASFEPKWYWGTAGEAQFLAISGLTFSSSNPAIVSVNALGSLTAGSFTGKAIITATAGSLSYQTEVKVVQDFQPEFAQKRIVKVAVVVIDPQIPAAGGQRFSERFWAYNGGPDVMTRQVIDSMRSITNGVLDYQVVETHRTDNFFNVFGGTRLTVDSMYKLFLEPGWNTLRRVAETEGNSSFQYNEMLNAFNLCEKSNNKQIDEVWVWAMPFIGMWETNMTGNGAFWINGPVITGNSCTDMLTISGFNYERYAGCALHNFTHRVETSMYKLFPGPIRYADYDPPYPTGMVKNALQKYMAYDFLEPGQANLGNSHFPPNATKGYEYNNTTNVRSYQPNWKRYPFLFNETKNINCSAWGCESDCGLNWCSYWMRNVPKFKCKDQDGRLNNWWAYVIDYNEGKALESQTSDCDCKMFPDDTPPVVCSSKGNFPWHEWIADVKLDQVNYPSDKSQYSDFTQKKISLIKGTPSQLQITTGFSWYTYTEYVRIWADLNNDKVFSPNEQIGSSQIATPPNGTTKASALIPIFVPSGTLEGNYRIRISLKRGSYPEPCETFAYGEVEDYSLEVKNVAPCRLSTEISNVTCSSDQINFTLKANNTNGNQGKWVGLWPPFSPTGFPTVYEGFYGTSNNLSVQKGLANSLSLLISDQTNSSCNTSFTVTCPIIPPSQYCASNSAFPWEDWIARVKLSNLDNASGKSPYSDFTAQTVNVNAGSIIGMTLTTGFSYFTFDEFWKVWIDYNQDGVFDDVTESAISQKVPRPANGTSSYDSNLSLFVKGGFTQDIVTRMRVSMKRGSFPTPCEILPFGEVEDYKIKILAAQLQNTPDLSIQNFVAAPIGAQGAVIPFTFDLVNNGTAFALPNYKIGSYLSLDNQFSPDDVLVGEIPTGNTPIGIINNVQGAITVPIGLSTGNYFLILFADSDKQILESNELNNTSSRPFEVKSGTVVTNCPSQGLFPWEEWIAGVKIGNIQNNSGKSQYSDFSNTNFSLVKGGSTSAQLTTGFSYLTSDMNWKIWIDYNQNKVFEEPGEQFAQGILPRPANGTPNASLTLNGKIPTSTLAGKTRMRVSMKKGGFPTPCEEFSRGEVEDYTVNILTNAFIISPDGQTDQPIMVSSLQNEGFILAPNPATNEVRIFVGESFQNASFVVRVMNHLGNLVIERQIENLAENQIYLDLGGIPNGLYFVSLENEVIGQVTQKLVVAHMH